MDAMANEWMAELLSWNNTSDFCFDWTEIRLECGGFRNYSMQWKIRKMVLGMWPMFYEFQR